MHVLLAVIVEPHPSCDPPCPTGYNCTESADGQYTCTGRSHTHTHTHTHTHARTHARTHPFNGPFSGATRVSRYQKGNNLNFTEARDSEWHWHQLGHIQVCTSLQTDNHTSTPPLCFFTGRMPFLPPNQQCQSTEGRAPNSLVKLLTAS